MTLGLSDHDANEEIKRLINEANDGLRHMDERANFLDVKRRDESRRIKIRDVS